MAGSNDEADKQGFTFRPLRLEDPDEIDGFRLVARLGHGGMGTVYLSHMADGTPAALKVIRPELAEAPDFQYQFQREVGAAECVEGAFLVPVLQSDTEGAVPWLATTYVAGPPLGDAVREHGPLAPEVVVQLVAGVAEALQLIHASGVVHRDLKPSNVLLAEDGPRVIDFGVARAVDATTIAASGRRLGTPGFMAPEQVRGGEVTAQADIFSLGLLACFAATGAGAFGRGEPEVLLYRIIHDEPDLAACPDGLREVIAACLAKDPEQRPEADQVLEACRVLGGGRPVRPTLGWLPKPLVADVARRAAPLPQAPTQPGWMVGAAGPGAGIPGATPVLAGGPGARRGYGDAPVSSDRDEAPHVRGATDLSGSVSDAEIPDHQEAANEPDDETAVEAAEPVARFGSPAVFGGYGTGSGHGPYRGGFGPVIIRRADSSGLDEESTLGGHTGGPAPLFMTGGEAEQPPSSVPDGATETAVSGPDGGNEAETAQDAETEVRARTSEARATETAPGASADLADGAVADQETQWLTPTWDGGAAVGVTAPESAREAPQAAEESEPAEGPGAVAELDRTGRPVTGPEPAEVDDSAADPEAEAEADAAQGDESGTVEQKPDLTQTKHEPSGAETVSLTKAWRGRRIIPAPRNGGTSTPAWSRTSVPDSGAEVAPTRPDDPSADSDAGAEPGRRLRVFAPSVDSLSLGTATPAGPQQSGPAFEASLSGSGAALGEPPSGGAATRRGGHRRGRTAANAAVSTVVALAMVVGGSWALGLGGSGDGGEHDVADLAVEGEIPAPEVPKENIAADRPDEDVTEPDETEKEKAKAEKEKAEKAEAAEQAEAAEEAAADAAPPPAETTPEPAPDPAPEPEPERSRSTPDPNRSAPSAPSRPSPGQAGRDNCSHSQDRNRIWAEGMAGTTVTQIQCLLNNNYNHNLDTDGIFGPQTASAVRSVQSCSGIAVDGEVGPDTWRYLDTPLRSCGN